MLVGVDLSQIEPCEEALLDAHEGSLVLVPDAPCRHEFEQRRLRHAERARADAEHLGTEARMAGGERVSILLNVARPRSWRASIPRTWTASGWCAPSACSTPASSSPGEEEQYRAYRRIAEWAVGRPVTIRTLDAGGDKPIRA